MDASTLPDTETLIARYAPDRTTPHIRVNFVSSIDGAVEVDGLSAALGSPADKLVFGLLRMFADGLLVGAGTLRHERYGPVRLKAERRTWREEHRLAPHPRLVIVSGRLDLDPTSSVFTDAPVRPIVITHASSDDQRRDALAEVADVLVHGVDQVDLIAAVAELREAYQLGQILCEGGPHLFGTLHAADLVDEVCLTLSPLVAGAGAGRIIAGSPSRPTERMVLRHAIAVPDGTLLLRYTRP
jgi:riboflavin biosynthesis pyrimidine reductase